MDYIFIQTVDKKAQEYLRKTQERHPEMFHPEFLQETNIKLMKNNGIVLAYLNRLQKQYGEGVNIWKPTEFIFTDKDYPAPIRKLGDWLLKGRMNLKLLPKQLGITREELMDIKMSRKEN